MKTNHGKTLLAIGIEAAEASLVRRLIDQDQLPVLKSLLANGKWLRVNSPTHIGTSAVWPCFMTGQDVADHGIYSEWCWEPATMSVSTLTGDGSQPFWKMFAETGQSVGVLGVPFMPFVAGLPGFQISDTPPFLHRGGASAVSSSITKQTVIEAMSRGHVSVSGPDDFPNLRKLAADAMAGIKLRGELAERLLKETKPDVSIIVFTETHESGHCLWQTIEPSHPLFKEDFFEKYKDIRPGVSEIYQEVDRQIGQLIATVDSRSTIMVFALHGMRPARGVPTFLAPMMSAAGFSAMADFEDQTWSGRGRRLLATAKRAVPAPLKRIYYRALPRATVFRWAAPTIMPPYDWSRTRVFPLVTEQHASIRVNLVGREAKGIVPPADYDKVCGEVEGWLRALRAIDGSPLTKEVIRTAATADEARTRRIPDVLAHWTDAAFASPLRIEGSDAEFYSDGARYLTQHTSEGFCILSQADALQNRDSIEAKDLGRLMQQIVLPATPQFTGAVRSHAP